MGSFSWLSTHHEVEPDSADVRIELADGVDAGRRVRGRGGRAERQVSAIFAAGRAAQQRDLRRKRGIYHRYLINRLRMYRENILNYIYNVHMSIFLC
jgi:hypothetical protein